MLWETSHCLQSCWRGWPHDSPCMPTRSEVKVTM